MAVLGSDTSGRFSFIGRSLEEYSREFQKRNFENSLFDFFLNQMVTLEF